ncbi:bifunctional hydroxymethylpyrimidine kinase/phosphomethylpyrimidine kinase [Corynebacterium mayonis]|uniref:bifunctional hydroxymethylpyrimidine kinase/phosphomethylpyrimidine kinase n=1 Tax=Corynebacterium mayonis TaxID=3062461 RepID=UPI0031403749
MTKQQPRVLTIAGTDPTGGAGVQADLKSIAAAGGYGMSVVTALVAQNTRGVRQVHTPPQEFLRAQLDSVFDDVSVDAVKVGMLGDATTTATVSDYLASHPVGTVVVDPVMVATSGDRLLSEDAEDALRQFIRDHATVVTPNIPELSVLTGTPAASTFDEAIAQGASYARNTGVFVLVKGGHLSGDDASNALVTPSGEVHRVHVARVDTPNTHGTGCSLSAALATRLLIDATPAHATEWASAWLHEAIANADALNVGQGHGPVDHFHRIRRLAASADTTPWEVNPPLPTTELIAPRIAAAGPHTQALWDRAAAKVWPDTLALPFIAALRHGTLSPQDFEFYLAQDAYYLGEYARALAAVAAKAPDTETQIWWSQSSVEATAGEAELHRTWFAARGMDTTVEPSPVTLGYVSFLKSETALSDYVVAAASVLPCFWLYAEVGLTLADANHPNHPFAEWLNMYGGEDFIESAAKAIAATEAALADATEKQRELAARAFMNACFYEREFFDQAARRGAS